MTTLTALPFLKSDLHLRDPVTTTIERHTPSLMRVARRYSLCADDAHDAYQRGVEIYIRNVGRLEPETTVGWLRTVIRNEALAVRKARQRLIAACEFDLDRQEARHLPSLDEAVASADLAARSVSILKENERRALILRAQGHSYRQICELTGWTYTKVNRCLSEGRSRLRERLSSLR